MRPDEVVLGAELVEGALLGSEVGARGPNRIAFENEVHVLVVSKLKRRTDMYLSSLRRFVEAMGGELEISASFPDRKVRIQLFEDLETKEPVEARAGWIWREPGEGTTSDNK